MKSIKKQFINDQKKKEFEAPVDNKIEQKLDHLTHRVEQLVMLVSSLSDYVKTLRARRCVAPCSSTSQGCGPLSTERG